ncbi:MAG: hypothetical protein ACRDZN_01835 [Acidimicrobiales bacterium]
MLLPADSLFRRRDAVSVIGAALTARAAGLSIVTVAARVVGVPFHATADDLAQAVDDLQADWGVDRRQRWIADTPARPGREETPARAAAAARPALSIAEERAEAHARKQALEADYFDLRSGSGRWRNTPEGAAARALTAAQEELTAAQRTAADPNARRRDRRTTMKSSPHLEGALTAAEQRWQQIGEPAAANLWSKVTAADREIQRLDSQAMIERLDRLQQPPERTLGQHPGISL